MKSENVRWLFILIQSALSGKKLSEEEPAGLTEDVLCELLELSRRFDLAHLVGAALNQNQLPDKSSETYEPWQLLQIQAVYRYERLAFEYAALCDSLEAAEVPFLPLKGAVMRQYYPEPWMRTSCDLDILIHREDLARAQEYLTSRCGYTYKGETAHDISLFSPGGQHLELHFRLLESERLPKAVKLLDTVWDHVSLREGRRFWYEMTDEMFYFYHIVHLAKHFENGGCGLRPLIDLWLLDRLPADVDKRDLLLQQGGLLTFAKVCRRLSEQWLEQKPLDPVTEQMQAFILKGGIYGTWENHVAMEQQKRGSRGKYLFHKVFAPYETMKDRYPVLKKHRWLTPVMQVYRWGQLLFGGRLWRVDRVVRYSAGTSQETIDQLQQLLNDIGL